MTEENENDDNITLGEIEKATQFKGELNYELILSKQINRIAIYREVNIKQYASSIDTLIIMLAKDLRREAKKERDRLGLILGDYDNMNKDRQRKYDDLWIYVNDLLEDNKLIFKKASFARGHA